MWQRGMLFSHQNNCRECMEMVSVGVAVLLKVKGLSSVIIGHIQNVVSIGVTYQCESVVLEWDILLKILSYAWSWASAVV